MDSFNAQLKGSGEAERRPAIAARLAEQLRAWSGAPLIVLGCVIGYRATAAGAPVAGLMLASAVGGLGALRLYYLLRYLRGGGPR